MPSIYKARSRAGSKHGTKRRRSKSRSRSRKGSKKSETATATPAEFLKAISHVKRLQRELSKSKGEMLTCKPKHWGRQVADKSDNKYFLLTAGKTLKMPVYYRAGKLSFTGLRAADTRCHQLMGSEKGVKHADKFCTEVKNLFEIAKKVSDCEK